MRNISGDTMHRYVRNRGERDKLNNIALKELKDEVVI